MVKPYKIKPDVFKPTLFHTVDDEQVRIFSEMGMEPEEIPEERQLRPARRPPGRPRKGARAVKAAPAVAFNYIALPLFAMADNPRMRHGISMPEGWTPDLLWQAFIEHNRNLHDAYKGSPAAHPFTEKLMHRFSIQRITPDKMADLDPDERDMFLQAKEPAGKFPHMVRDVFLLLADRPHRPGESFQMAGELWIDTYSPTRAEHSYILNPAMPKTKPDPDRVVLLWPAGAGSGSAATDRWTNVRASSLTPSRITTVQALRKT